MGGAALAALNAGIVAQGGKAIKGPLFVGAFIIENEAGEYQTVAQVTDGPGKDANVVFENNMDWVNYLSQRAVQKMERQYNGTFLGGLFQTNWQVRDVRKGEAKTTK